MFISRKKYEEAINKALYEQEERIYRQNERDRMNKRISKLEHEVAEMKKAMETPIVANGCLETAPNTDFVEQMWGCVNE